MAGGNRSAESGLAERQVDPAANVGLQDDALQLQHVFDAATGHLIPYHNLFDAGDAQIMESAVAAGNTMLVHFELGDTIPTVPGGSRFVRLCVPNLCTVAFAKRALCRLVPGMYPSFLEMWVPTTGEVLEDYELGEGGADNGAARPALPAHRGDERTLRSYGVQHDSVLILDVTEGDIFEGLRVQLQPQAQALGAEERGEPNGAAEPEAHGGAAAQETTSGATGSAGEQQKKKRPWSRDETLALLEGIIKYRGTPWAAILRDPELRDAFDRRTDVNMKDRWVNLKKAKKRNFENMGMDDKAIRAKVMEAYEILRKK